jgi:mannose-6-phosphate isomerase-like protein (cupin superfamily)
MEIIDARDFRADRAWGACDIAHIADASVRLHWTNEPYHWHRNTEQEVFVVLAGTVQMHVRKDGAEVSYRLEPGDIFRADTGDEHVAHPIGEARILVIEEKGAE